MRSRLLLGGSALLCGTLVTASAYGDPPIVDKVPTLTTPIVYQNEFGTYIDRPPFVQTVNWDHPLIRAAEGSFGQWDAQGNEINPGISRSTMSYGDHIESYGLNKDDDWNGVAGLYKHWWNRPESAERTRRLTGLDKRIARANYENFVKTLLGEYRDYPFMIKRKLEIVASHAPVNKKGPQTAPVDQAFLFDSLTGDGYARLRWIMSAVYSARQARLNPNPSGFNYAFNEPGHVCNRVDNSVKPTTHAEMRYIFAEWLQGPPKAFTIEAYERGLERFIQQHCDPSPAGPDLGYSYDFRGDKNFKANWMECNGFIWSSRHYARMLQAQLRAGATPDVSYNQRPFATRYARTRELLAMYLFYPSADHKHLRQASERGGGPHLYIDFEDGNGDGVADYRLFPDVMGQGDIGLESQALPSAQVAAKEPTRATVATFTRARFRTYKDWGFNGTFNVTASNRARFAEDAVFSPGDSAAQATFKLRMARLNQALDRHTNWGPTHMFSNQAFATAKRYAIRGAYSPIVAMSYEISKSHSFAVGDFAATHPKDQGKTKWMFFVKFPTRNYYDERDLRAGKSIQWDRMYLNESSLSNDFYVERALDKFGWIPAADMHTAAYLPEAGGEHTYRPPVGTGISTVIEGQ